MIDTTTWRSPRDTEGKTSLEIMEFPGSVTFRACDDKRVVDVEFPPDYVRDIIMTLSIWLEKEEAGLND